MMADVHAIPLLLAILATYRVAHMVTSEEGPFAIFDRWRACFDRFGADERWSWLQRGVNCVMCVSFWLSIASALFFAWLYWLPFHVFVFVWLAIAGGVLTIERFAR